MGRALLALALSLRGHDKPQKQPLMVSLAIPSTYTLDSTLSSHPSPRAVDVTTFAETAIHHGPAESHQPFWWRCDCGSCSVTSVFSDRAAANRDGRYKYMPYYTGDGISNSTGIH